MSLSRVKHFLPMLIASFASFFLFMASALAFSATDIKDVSHTDPKIGIYLDLLNNNGFSLDKNGNFRPDENINRAAFFKVALSYIGYQPSKTFNYFTGYLDVPEESWFAPYIKKALEMRVVSNQLNDNFYPNDTITRQEGLLHVMRIYGIPTPLISPEAKDLYEDIRLTHPFASVYAAAKAHSIYFENDQKNFRPIKTLTRGDAADLLFKAKLSAENGGTIISVSTNSPSLTSDEKDLLENDKFGILMDAWARINNQYIYTNNYTQDQLVYGAISGMVDSLNDPYSTFKSPSSSGQSYIYIPENYEGIGAIIEQIEGKFIIQTTITNSPAFRGGIKAHDEILEIDGQDVTGKTYEELTSMIKGPAGTIVKLRLKRADTILNFEIVREKITIEAIQEKDLGSGIKYLRINQFTENSNTEFTTHLNNLKTSGANKLIIDLRNNPGGYLSSTQDMLGHFLTNGQIEFYTADKNQQQIAYISNGEGEFKNLKTAILVNEGSASASEIFAGAMQDYKLARIIGSTTFGKGSVQEITSYTDNSSLKLTIAKWMTPLLRSINHVGIVPDETVSITDEQRQLGLDPQLDAAINYLNR